jgi:hypothetical protein
MSRAAWLVLAITASCYTPSARDCSFQCSAASACPSGLACDSEGYCRAPGTTLSCSVIIANDGNSGTGDGAACDWSKLTPTNFLPAALPAQQGSWMVTADDSYDTTLGQSATGPTGIVQVQNGGAMARLVYVDDFTVPAGKTLKIVGTLPMIVVANTITVNGTIDLRGGADGASCARTVPTDNCYSGGGGGGGGLGQGGGSGGGPEVVGAGAPAFGTTALDPLVYGCSGQAGGVFTTGGMIAAAGGLGGGGLELSAQYQVTINGLIDGNGRGGQPGNSSGTVTCNTGHLPSSGGGGGGGGGAILVEGCAVAITGNLCANGGAGGGGGQTTAPGTAVAGGDATCTAQALGGKGGQTSSPGGNGGFQTMGATAGGTATAQYGSGGGGGGGIGRIRVHALSRMLGGVISPLATID